MSWEAVLCLASQTGTDRRFECVLKGCLNIWTPLQVDARSLSGLSNFSSITQHHLQTRRAPELGFTLDIWSVRVGNRRSVPVDLKLSLQMLKTNSPPFYYSTGNTVICQTSRTGFRVDFLDSCALLWKRSAACMCSPSAPSWPVEARRTPVPSASGEKNISRQAAHRDGWWLFYFLVVAVWPSQEEVDKSVRFLLREHCCSEL